MNSKALDLMWRTGKTVQNARPSDIGPLPNMYGTILQMHARSYRLFRGLYILVQHNELESAYIVCRSLFEQTLRMHEYREQENEEKLQARLLAWAKRSATTQRHDIEYMKDYVDADLYESLHEIVRQSLTEIASELSNLTIDPIPKPDSLKEIARRNGFAEDYVTYLTMHDFTHGGHMSHFLFRSETNPDTGYVDILNRPRDDMDLSTHVASLGSVLIIFNFIACAFILEWDIPSSIDRVLEDAIDMKNADRDNLTT